MHMHNYSSLRFLTLVINNCTCVLSVTAFTNKYNSGIRAKQWYNKWAWYTAQQVRNWKAIFTKQTETTNWHTTL